MEPDHIRGYLISVKKNGENGCSYAVRNPICYIGRDTSCNIRIRDENVNNRHCCIRIESAKKIIVQSLCSERPVFVKEIGNVDGTKIHDEKVASADGIQIQPGTLIKILDYTFRWVNVEPSGGDIVQRCSYLCNEKLCPRKSDPILYQVTDEPKITDENENSQIKPTEPDRNISTTTIEKDEPTAIENVSMNPRISSTIKDSVISTSMSMSPSKNTPNVSVNQSISRRSRLNYETINGKRESGDFYEKHASPTLSRLSHIKTPNSPLQESNRTSLVQSERRSFRKLSVDASNIIPDTMSKDSIGKSATNDISFTKATNDSCARPASNYYEDVTLDECKEMTVSNENVTPETQDNDVSNTEKSALQTPKSFINAFHSTPNYSPPEKSSFSDFHSKTTDVVVTSETNSEMFSAVASFTNDNACVSSPLPSINGLSPATNKEVTVAEDESSMSTPKSLSIAASRCRRSTIEPMVGTPSDVYRVTKCFVTPGNRFHFNQTSMEVQTSNVTEASRRSERKSTPMKVEKNSVRDSLLLYSPIIENQKGEEEQREDEPYKFVSRRKPRFGINSFADENRIVEENETMGEDVDDSLQPLDSFEQEDNSIPTRIVVGGETSGSNSTFGIENENEELNRTFEVGGGESQMIAEEGKSPMVTKSVPKSILTPLPRQQSAKTTKKVTFSGLNERVSNVGPISPYSPQETVDDMSVSGINCSLTETSVASETNKMAEEDERLYREDEPSELDLESSIESNRLKSISPRLSGVKRLFIPVESPKNSVNLSGTKTLMETPVSVQKTVCSSDMPKIRVQEPTPSRENSSNASFVSPMVRRCSKHLRIHRNSICQLTDTTLVETEKSDEAQESAADCSASLNNSMVNAENGNEEQAKANYDRVVDELNEVLTRVQKNRSEIDERPIEDEKTIEDKIVAAPEMENNILDEEIDSLEISIDENIPNEPGSPIKNETNVTTENRVDDEALHEKTPASMTLRVSQNFPQLEKHVSFQFEGISTPVNSEPTAPKRISTPYVRASSCQNLTPVDDVREYSIVEEPAATSAQSTPRDDDSNETPTTVAVPIVVRTASPPARQTVLTPGQLNNNEVLLSDAAIGSVSAVQHIRTSTPLSWFAAKKGIDPKTFYAARNEGTITEISGISIPSSNCESPMTTTQTNSAESTIVSTESAVKNIKTERVTQESLESSRSTVGTVNEEEVNVIPLAIVKDVEEMEHAEETVVATSDDVSVLSENRETTLTPSASKPNDVAELEQPLNVGEKVTADSIEPELPSISNKFKMEVILRGSRRSVVMEKFRNILQGMDADIVDVKQLTDVEDDPAKEAETVKENANQESQDEQAEKKITQGDDNLAANENENEIEATESTTTTRKKRKATTANSRTATTINRSTRRTKNETKTELPTTAEMQVEVPKIIKPEDTASKERPLQNRTIRSKKLANDKATFGHSSSLNNVENVDDGASSVCTAVEEVETKSRRPKRNATVKAETVAVQLQVPAKKNVKRNSVDKKKAVVEAETVVQSTLPSKSRKARNSTDKTKTKNGTSSATSAIDASTEIDLIGTASIAQEPAVDGEKTKKSTRNTRRVKNTIDDNNVASAADVQSKVPAKTRAKSREQKNATVESVESVTTTMTEEQPLSPRKSKRKKKIDDATPVNTVEKDDRKAKRKPLTPVLQNNEPKEDERQNKRNVGIISEPEKTKKTKRGAKVDVIEEKPAVKSKKKSDEFSQKLTAIVEPSVEIQPQSKGNRNNKRAVKMTEERIPSVEPSQTKQTKSKPASKLAEKATTSIKMNAKSVVVEVSPPAVVKGTRNKRKMAAETITPQPTTTRSKRKLNADSETKPSSDSAKSISEPATKRAKLAEPVAAETNTRTRRQSVYSTRSTKQRNKRT